MLETIRISNLPSYAKLFIGLFVTLMLCVCSWAMLILYVDKGMVSESEIPPYVSDPYGQPDTAASSSIEDESEEVTDFEHNVKLAHTHINGQSLLFFAIGLIFLFSSAKPQIKNFLFWIFAISIVIHNIGLTGENYHWIYNEMIAVSGVLILVSIAYMAFVIYADLLRKPADAK